MPLTPDERTLINAHRADMAVAATKALVYQGALRIYEDTPPPPWWRWIRRQRRTLAMRHTSRMWDSYREEVVLLSSVIQAWVAAHEILAGQSRGPIIHPARTP